MGDDAATSSAQSSQKRSATPAEASVLPEGFFDDPKAQQTVEDEITKAAFTRLAESRTPAAPSGPLSTPVVNPVEYGS